jgi:tetratricopeptide (TPR) repeat protein
MVLNEKQHARLKQFMSNYLFNTENYVKLEPSDASIVLKSIIDDVTYNNESTRVQEPMLSIVNHLRSIIHHQCPQDVNIEENGVVDETNGLSQMNDNTADGITKSDVVRFITDSIEKEILVQQRILKSTKKNTTPVTPIEKAAPPQFTADVQLFWNDIVEMVDTETELCSAAYHTLIKWFGNEDMKFLRTVDSELANYLIQCTVQAPSDIETILTINLCLILLRVPSAQRTALELECLDELENGAPLINKTRHRNLKVIIYTVRGLTETDLQLAIQALNKAITLDSTYAVALACRASVYRGHQMYEEAMIDYTTAISIFPKCAIKGRAELWAQVAHFGEALQDYQMALEYFPDDVDTLVQVGSLYETLGRYEESYDKFARVVALDPRNVSAINHIADMLFVMGSSEEALSELDRSLQIEPLSITYLSKAQMYQVLNRPKQAVDNAKKSLAINKDAPLIVSACNAVFAWAKRETEKPIQHHEQTISYIIEHSVPVYGVANIWNKLNGVAVKAYFKKEYPAFLNDALDETKLYWKKFFEPFLVTNKLHTAHVQISDELLFYYKSHLFMKVERDLLRLSQKFIDSDPETMNYLLLARSLIPDMPNFPNAIEMLDDCIQYFMTRFNESPNNVRIKNAYILSLQQRAWKHFTVSNFQQAIPDYLECIDLEPTYIKAYIGLAVAFQQNGNPLEALNTIYTGIRLDYLHHEEPLYFKGLLLLDMRDFPEAYKALKEATILEKKKNLPINSQLFDQAIRTIAEMDEHLAENSNE